MKLITKTGVRAALVVFLFLNWQPTGGNYPKKACRRQSKTGAEHRPGPPAWPGGETQGLPGGGAPGCQLYPGM